MTDTITKKTIKKVIEFDFSKIQVMDAYRLMIESIVPRPIALISTISPEGVVNVAPFSYFMAVSSSPACLAFSVTFKRGGEKKDTLINIEKTRQFVFNSSTQEIAKQINDCSAEYPYGVSELTEVGLTAAPSLKVSPPRIAESAVQMECKLHQLVPIGEGAAGSTTLVIGQIVYAHVQERVYKNGHIDPMSYQPLARLGGTLYTGITEPMDLARPTLQTRS